MGQKQPALYKPFCFRYNFVVLKKTIGCRLLFGACGGRQVGMAAQRHETFE